MKRHPQEQRLGYNLKRAQHALRQFMDRRLEPLSLTVAQYNVLSAVEQDPGISNAALARGAFVTAQSMVDTVKTLERIGLIRRKPDPDHGRVRKTELTSKGKVLLIDAHEALSTIEVVMTSGFTPGEEAAFRNFLLRCTKNFSAEDS